MYEKVKEVTGTNRKNSGNSCIKNKEGKVLFDQQEIQDRWTEYLEGFFNDERGEIPEIENLNADAVVMMFPIAKGVGLSVVKKVSFWFVHTFDVLSRDLVDLSGFAVIYLLACSSSCFFWTNIYPVF